MFVLRLSRKTCDLLFANITATRRFLRACTARPLGDDEVAAALARNMVVPPAIRRALLSRELDGSDILARASVPSLSHTDATT